MNLAYPSSMPYALLMFLLLLWLPLGAAQAQTGAELGTDSAADNESLTPVAIQLQWRHQWQFAGFYAALEKGYYREAGLAVRLVEHSDGVDVVDEVLSARAQFGTHSVELLRERMQGTPIVLLASYFRRSPLVLAVRPELMLPSVLAGKRIMATPDVIASVNLPQMFANFAINPSDFELVAPEPDFDAFVRGEVDAVAAFRTNELFQLYKRCVPFGVIDPGQVDASSGGFGLCHLRSRIELLGGSIEIENRPRGGGLVCVDLPLEPVKECSGTDRDWLPRLG